MGANFLNEAANRLQREGEVLFAFRLNGMADLRDACS
jgi:hypothetical protein